MESMKKTTRLLSNVDREILKAILSSNGKHRSSTLLSKSLGVPQNYYSEKTQQTRKGIPGIIIFTKPRKVWLASC